MKHDLIAILERMNRRGERSCRCKRKSVGCQLLRGYENGEIDCQAEAFNGPTSGECSGEVGKCGCSHAEPRAIMEGIRRGALPGRQLVLCSYSPCTNCANIIVDSGLACVVVYGEFTEHDPRGVQILRQAGIWVSDIGSIEDKAIEEWIYGKARG